MRSLITAWLAAAAIIACSSSRVAAQVVRGTVRDSATRAPIAGAVLLLLDESSKPMARGLTDAHGEYRLALTAAARRMRVLRIGFRPRDIALPLSASSDVTFDVAMAALPTLLEPVHITSGAKCSARDDRLMALSLLDQARAALLGSIVARENRPAAEMMRLRFTRFMDSKTGRATMMHVVADSTTDPRVSFQASRSASEFVASGFVSDTLDVETFHGPDAEVLVDDAFLNGYCFELRKPDATRPNQVGLGFSAASSRDGRVDIDGTLWVDTLARQIEEIRFDYRGLPANELAVHPGGSIHFRQLANGTVLVDRWSLRLPTAQPETTYHFGGPTIATVVGVDETGGAIAAARWPDGFRWAAPLDTVRLQLSGDRATELAGRQVALVGTPYRGISNATGAIVIPRILPGPYDGVVVDSTLARIGILFPASFKFSVADGGLTNVAVELPSVSRYVTSQCKQLQEPQPTATDLLVVGRITDPVNEPLKDVAWRLFERAGGTRIPVATGETRADGLFAYCGGMLPPSESLEIDALPSNLTSWHTTAIPVEKSLIVARVEVESKKLLGVYDNDNGQWIAGATIRDTLGNEAVTSRIGVAALTTLTPVAGYYMLEIRKPGYSPRWIRVRGDTTSEVLTPLAPNPLGAAVLAPTVVTAGRKLATDAGEQDGFEFRCGTGLITCIGRSVLDRHTTGSLDTFLDHVDGINHICSSRTEAQFHSSAQAPQVGCKIEMKPLGGQPLCIPNYVVNGFDWSPLGGDPQAELDQFLNSATIEGIEVYLPGHPVPQRFDPKPFSECGVVVIWTR